MAIKEIEWSETYKMVRGAQNETCQYILYKKEGKIVDIARA